jgi:anti-anti-sigma factor
MTFSCVSEAIENGVSIAFTGELDAATADQSRAAIESVELEAGQRLVLDISGLEFMDSTGLRLLIQAQNDARAGDYELVVVTGDSPAARVIELTNADAHIDVVKSLG